MSLIQKYVIPATFILSTHGAFCGTMGPEKVDHFVAKENFYIGAGIGGAFDNHNLTTTNNLTGFFVKNSLNSSSLIGDVFIGYGYTAANSFYLGGEIGTYFPRRTSTIYGRPGVAFTGFTFTDILRIQDYATLDILPGYRFNPAMLIYGRAGISFSELSINQPANTAASTVSFSNSKNKIGGRFGAGITYALSQHFSASLDYYYTTYQKFNTYVPLYSISLIDSASSNFAGVSITYTI